MKKGKRKWRTKSRWMKGVYEGGNRWIREGMKGRWKKGRTVGGR